MMNNPFVLEQAELWSKHLLADAKASVRERIERMVVAALGRPASAAELTDMFAFLAARQAAVGLEDMADMLAQGPPVRPDSERVSRRSIALVPERGAEVMVGAAS